MRLVFLSDSNPNGKSQDAIFASLNAQENCKIKGAVIDKKTGKSLEGVYIYLNDSSELKTLTDENGRYELSGLSLQRSCFPGSRLR